VNRLIIWPGGTTKAERFTHLSAKPKEAVNVASCPIDTLQLKSERVWPRMWRDGLQEKLVVAQPVKNFSLP
jgi:hypothetical protein